MPAPPSSSALPPMLARPLAERWLGPLRLICQLGRGGFAPVWLAEEVYQGRKLRSAAVKLFFLPEGIAPRSARAAAFHDAVLEEARALCRVEHPNVVRFYALHADEDQGVVGLSMEHVAGESLDVALRARGSLGDRETLEVGAAAAWALAAVHGAGLVHRDVKPANLVRAASGFKLIDFGIVVEAPEDPGPDRDRAADEGDAGSATWSTLAPSSRRPPPLAGTPGYIAPECVYLGEPASRASDLYALGVTLFHLRTGALPVPPDRDLARRAPAPTMVTGPLAALVARLVDPDPAARPRHADWVARELDRLRFSLGGEASCENDTKGEGSLDLPELTVRDAERETHSAAMAPTLEATSDLCDPRSPRDRAPDLRPPLVGRREALATLGRAIAEASQGGVRAALVTGPLGIGRTRVLDEAARAAALSRGRALRLACSPERRSPLRPLIRALEALPDEARRALDPVSRAVSRALAATALPGPDAGEGLEGVEEAIVRASAETPLLLAIDDLQWADAHLCELLTLLASRAEEERAAGRLAILLAARHEASPPRALQKLYARLRGRARPGVWHVPLAPLSEAEAGALAHAVLPVDAATLAAVVRGAGGVPFFVVHALAAWHQKGALTWDAGAFRAADPRHLAEEVPGVAEHLEARIAAHFDLGSREGRAAQRALAAVAISGGGLPAAILLRVIGDDEHAEIALEALLDAGIFVASGPRQEHSFAQEMMRQAAQNLFRARPWFLRVQRALLDALAGSPSSADAAFLAAGYEQLGALSEARAWLARAMDAACFTGLFDEAAELGDRLAALAPDPEARAAVELSVAHALIQGRMFEAARARLSRLADLGLATRGGSRPLDLRARIHHLQIARKLHEPGAGDPSLVADADASGLVDLRGDARLAAAGVARGDAAMALAGEAVDLAARRGLVEEFTARLLRVEINAGSERRDLALARADLERALAIAAVSGSEWHRVFVESDLAVIEAESGDVPAAIERLSRLAELAERAGMREQHLLIAHNLAVYLLGAGRLTEAAAHAGRAADLAAKAGDSAVRANALSILADARRRAGDLEGALAGVTEAEGLQRARGDAWLSLTLLRRADILEAQGRVAEALAAARAARDLAEAHAQAALVIAARLWDARLARELGEGARGDLERALAEADEADRRGMDLREITRAQMAKARAILG